MYKKLHRLWVPEAPYQVNLIKTTNRKLGEKKAIEKIISILTSDRLETRKMMKTPKRIGVRSC